jgi:glutamate transport system ATP-binding protein
VSTSIVLLVVLVVSSAIIVASAMTIADLVDRLRALERQVLTDPLTGAFNRRHLDDCLRGAVERRRRDGESACLAVFDVDRFKDINDLLGHAAGDAVLKALVVLFQRCARTLDLLFRTGGEEFALLLPSTDLESALVVADRLRARIAASRLIFGHVMTVSVGVSALRDGQSPHDWIADADQALYAAKRAGRNQVACFDVYSQTDGVVDVVNPWRAPRRKTIESRVMHSIPLLSLEHVNKHFGSVHVLRDINLTVATGEVVVVVGPSGGGKSTLCRTINRLETIDRGTIRFEGRPLPDEGAALAHLRADVGMVFQSFNLFAHKTILENVTLGPITVRKISREEAERRGMALLERVGIAAHASKYPSQLSGGQQQRTAIARALAMDPKLILFDEPTSALDPEMVQEVLDVMIELAGNGMSMLVVSHEMGFARRAADRVVFMAGGQIVEENAPDEFFTRPQTDRANEFLSKLLVQ